MDSFVKREKQYMRCCSPFYTPYTAKGTYSLKWIQAHCCKIVIGIPEQSLSSSTNKLVGNLSGPSEEFGNLEGTLKERLGRIGNGLSASDMDG